MTGVLDAPAPFVTGDPEGVRATARSLADRGESFRSTAARLRASVGSLVGVSWRGHASHEAEARLVQSALLLEGWAARCDAAAAALRTYAAEMDSALDLSRRARSLDEQALSAQQAADQADPSLAVERSMSWSGAASPFNDPAARDLADRAARLAWEADQAAQAAVRRLVARLGELTGRTVSQRGPSPRLLVDLAGLAPIVGEPIDAINGAVYLGQGQWIDGLLSIAGAIPGPLGWAATGGRIGKSLDEADDVVSSVVRTDYEILATIRDRADALQARHVDPRFVAIYRDRSTLVEQAAASASQSERRMTMPFEQLRDKYKHAPRLFDLAEGAFPNRWRDFGEHCERFMTASSTVKVEGTYKGQAATFFVDSVDMRRFVMAHPDGTFWSGWVMGRGQATSFWRDHAVS